MWSLHKGEENKNGGGKCKSSESHIAKWEHIIPQQRQCKREYQKQTLLSPRLLRKKEKQERTKVEFLHCHSKLTISANNMISSSLHKNQRLHLLITSLLAVYIGSLGRSGFL